MTTKSPDKCAERAAEKIDRLFQVGFAPADKKLELTEFQILKIASIITESYAPTIQVAREAMENSLKALDDNMNTIDRNFYRKLATEQLRTALEQLK